MKKYYSLKESAKFLKVNYRTILRYISEGKLQSVMQNRRKFISYNSLKKMKNTLKIYKNQQKQLKGKKFMGVTSSAKYLNVSRMTIHRYLRGYKNIYLPAIKKPWGTLISIKDLEELKKNLKKMT